MVEVKGGGRRLEVLVAVVAVRDFVDFAFAGRREGWAKAETERGSLADGLARIWYGDLRPDRNRGRRFSVGERRNSW